MATALNMKWKLPVAYFLLPDGFSSEKRAELIRNCIFHLNSTGAIVTSLVMDNCPVNYATFRRYRYYAKLFTETLNNFKYKSPSFSYTVFLQPFSHQLFELCDFFTSNLQLIKFKITGCY